MRGARPAHVTGVAEEVGVQREALRAWFIGELLPTLLYKETAETSISETHWCIIKSGNEAD